MPPVEMISRRAAHLYAYFFFLLAINLTVPATAVIAAAATANSFKAVVTPATLDGA